MAENLGIPYFDGTNMDVEDWIHHYSGVLNAKGIYECVPRLLLAGSLLVGEAHQYWILLDAINKTKKGVYNSNEFCYDLHFRFHPETVEEAREMEEKLLKEDKKLGIPYFDGTNMHVQEWLHCYCGVLNAKGVYGCARRLLVAGSRLVGEAQKYWIELDAIKRDNEGEYNSNDFCYDLCKRFDPELMEERRIKEAQEILNSNYFDGTSGGVDDSNEFCNDLRERFNPEIMEKARGMEEHQLKEAQQKEWQQPCDKREEETENMDQILVEIRKLFVSDPQNDGYEHFTNGLCCLFEEADTALQGFDEMSHRTHTCGIALNEVDETKGAQKMLGERLKLVREDLPGFTRSVYKKDHALITPESHVFSPLPEWSNTMGAYLITPAMGSHFVMYLAKMEDNSKSGLPPDGVERLIFVVEGSVILRDSYGISYELTVDSYAYLPPEFEHSIKCDTVATLVVFERRYASLENHIPEFVIGSTDKQLLLETPGEIFELRKLLPTSLPYDFNIHIMDFQPGEFLNVKEVHYNQHGLLLLEGQGIYRLGDSWYPVQAGDVIWMAPFVPQWYAALGKTRSRYLLYKDVNRNPL